MRVCVSVLLLLTLAAPMRGGAHVLLDGAIAGPMLGDIATHLKASKEAPSEDARLEALYRLGETVNRLVEVMNLDVLGHGQSLYGDLLARRLAHYGLRIAFVERARRYVYDLTPFEEYVQKSSQGPHAADAKFRIIAETFHRSVGARPEELADGDLLGLEKAIRLKELFLKEHLSHPRLRDVRFFLALDYYRLHKNSPAPETVRRYERLARLALRAVVSDYPGTAEARSAEVVLKDLGDDGVAFPPPRR